MRNYQSKAERLTVSLQPNDWSVVKSAPSQPLTIAANRSENLAFRMQATRAVDKATQRVTAGNRDAIERSIRVHPDGQQTTQTFGDFVAGMASFTVSIPKTALPAGTRGELRVYPNIASLLLESAAAILFAPHGCAEQTISAGYSNLIAWRFSRAQGIPEPKIALTNVRLAVEALSGFRNPDGGVRYWNAGDANVAATAYALSFLVEASTLISIDMVVPLRMASWLEQHQSKDGTWGEQTSGSKNNLLLTATVVRALALAQKAGIKVSATVLAAAYHHIAQFTDRTDEPYMLANFILAVADSGDEALLGNAVARLTAMAREERGGLYWDMRTNSPFYGWGTAGRYETTGLVISALTRVRRQTGAVELDGVIRRGLVFLLRGRNATGYWYSTQSTLRAMSAIADASSALGHVGGVGGSLEVRANGRLVKTIAMPRDTKSTDPVILDLAAFLSPGDNQITVLPVGGMQSAMLHLTATHWQPWDKATVRSSPELRLAVQFDRSQSNAGEPVRCTVKAERIGFRGYGMMLAEIGLPPGAEVDRASLEAALVESSVGLDHYEILPDRVVLYLWPKAGGAAFDFFLSTRMAMSAKSAASVLYDYNNPEALAEVQPSRWLVK